jgi:hypothetical protein
LAQIALALLQDLHGQGIDLEILNGLGEAGQASGDGGRGVYLGERIRAAGAADVERGGQAGENLGDDRGCRLGERPGTADVGWGHGHLKTAS